MQAVEGSDSPCIQQTPSIGQYNYKHIKDFHIGETSILMLLERKTRNQRKEECCWDQDYAVANIIHGLFQSSFWNSKVRHLLESFKDILIVCAYIHTCISLVELWYNFKWRLRRERWKGWQRQWQTAKIKQPAAQSGPGNPGRIYCS